MDPYYKVKSDIHHKRPMFGYLVFTWMVLMTILAALFGIYLYNVETDHVCIVKNGSKVPDENKEQEYPMSSVDSSYSSDVSKDFSMVLTMFFV